MNEAEQQAFDEGYEAAMVGMGDDANPYPVESGEHLSWNDGYIAGEEEG